MRNRNGRFHVNAGIVMLLALTATAFSACASGSGGAGRNETTSTLAPSMVVERFLRAANSNDLDTMANLFGDQKGSWAKTVSKKDADDRLFTLATLLRHTDYAIRAEQLVPGRREEATQLPVDMTIKGKKLTLPFVLVRYQGGWLIEQIPVEIITESR